MRGPSIRPALIASRMATEIFQVEPGSENAVTPARSTFRALLAARRVRYSTLA